MFDYSNQSNYPMKTLSIVLIALAASLVWNSVSSQSISHYPKDNYGYLVMQSSPSTDYWSIQVIKRKYFNGTASDEVVKKYELWDTHFMKLPNEYFVDIADHEYLLEVHAVSQSQGVLFSQGPFSVIGDGTPFLPALRWVCNGTDYAWAIQQYVHPSGVGCRYRLESTAAAVDAFGTGIPYYRYMTTQQFIDAIGSSSFRQYHNIQWGEGPNKIIEFNTEDVSSNVYDFEGFPLFGDVTGVQKFLGPWRNAGAVTTSVLGHTWSSMTYEPVDYVLQILNNYSNMNELLSDGDIPELLTCNHAFALHPGNDYPGIEEGEINPLYMNCFHDLMDQPNDMDGDDDTDIYDNMLQYEDCVNHGVTGGWQWMNVDLIKDEGEQNVMSFNKEDIIDSNGTLQLPSFTMQPGLYEIVWSNQNNSVFRLVLENKSKIENSLVLSTFVSPQVYPVPHISKDFTVNIQSTVTTEIKYELLDSSLSRLHSISFIVKAGHDEEHEIISDLDIPAGVCFHKFTYSDGSFDLIPAVR
jgi:hypothetical protein